MLMERSILSRMPDRVIRDLLLTFVNHATPLMLSSLAKFVDYAVEYAGPSPSITRSATPARESVIIVLPGLQEEMAGVLSVVEVVEGVDPDGVEIERDSHALRAAAEEWCCLTELLS